MGRAPFQDMVTSMMQDFTGQTTKLPQNDEIDLAAIVRTLWASRWLIIATGVVGLAIGGIYARTRQPIWQADALIQIESKSSRLALPDALADLADQSETSSSTEIQILQSRSVLSDAAAAVKLDWHVSPKFVPVVGEALYYGRMLDHLGAAFDGYPRLGEGFSVRYLQLPEDWIDRPIEVMVLADSQYQVVLPDQTVRVGRENVLLTDKVLMFALELGHIDSAPGRKFEIRQSPEQVSVARLAASLKVEEEGRQTGILRVSMTAPTPIDATRWLDAVLAAYKNKSVTNNAAEASQSLRFVEEQLPAAEAQVKDAEQALNDYRSKQVSIDISFETERLLDEAAQLDSQIREALVQEGELGQRFTPNHPIFRQAVTNRKSLEARRQEVQSNIEKLPKTQREIVNLTRTLEVAQASYLQLLNRSQELRVLQASEIGNVRIIDSALAGQRTVAPRSLRISAIAAFLGLMLGAGIALLRNYFRRGVDSVEEIEQIGIPVLGVSNLETRAVRSEKGRVPLVVRDNTDGLNAEAFRSIRTALRFLRGGRNGKTLALTSPLPGAGKSFCAANLAVIFAQGGQRVCVVDADLRRGVLARSFGIPKAHAGLSDYLIGQAALDGVISATSIDRLDLVPTGRRPPNPSELLMSERFETFHTELAERYDVVIFDTPPTLLVTDAALISRLAGLTIVVARHADTDAQDLLTVRRTLELTGCQVHGAILNAFDPRRAKPSSYHYGRYGYGYGYRYRYSRTEPADQ